LGDFSPQRRKERKAKTIINRRGAETQRDLFVVFVGAALAANQFLLEHASIRG